MIKASKNIAESDLSELCNTITDKTKDLVLLDTEVQEIEDMLKATKEQQRFVQKELAIIRNLARNILNTNNPEKHLKFRTRAEKLLQTIYNERDQNNSKSVNESRDTVQEAMTSLEGLVNSLKTTVGDTIDMPTAALNTQEKA